MPRSSRGKTEGDLRQNLGGLQTRSKVGTSPVLFCDTGEEKRTGEVLDVVTAAIDPIGI